MKELDSDTLLEEATDRIDNLQSHLSSHGSGGGATEEGNLVRNLLGDEADLAAFPDVYKITNKNFLTKNFKVAKTLWNFSISQEELKKELGPKER